MQIYIFYLLTENKTILVEIHDNPIKKVDILQNMSDYWNYEIIEAIYQDLDVKIIVKEKMEVSWVNTRNKIRNYAKKF